MVKNSLRWRSVVLCAALFAGAAACGGGSSKSGLTAQVIVEATSHTNTAKFDTVVTFGSGKDRAVIESSGSVDSTKRRGDVSTRPLPTPSSPLTAAESTPTETRWVGDDIYAKGRSGLVGGGGGSRWVFVDAAKVHAASSCLAKIDVPSLLIGSGIESPSGTLDELRKQGKHLEEIGTDAIRGATTTHWRVAPAVWPSVHCSLTPTSRHTTVRVGLDIWTDRQDRARRLTLTETQTTTSVDAGPNNSHTPNTDTQTSTVTTDFSDFGTAVDVQAPPRDQVNDETDSYIAIVLGPGSVKASDWHDVAHGNIGGTPWKIAAARTTTGWYCYDPTDTPQNELGQVTANGFPTHDGHVTDCTVSGGLFALNGPVTVFVNTSSGGRRIIVGAVSGVGGARLVFRNGSSQPLAVDPHTLMFNWSAPVRPVPVRFQVGDQSCRIDGHGTDGLESNDYTPAGNSACMGAKP